MTMLRRLAPLSVLLFGILSIGPSSAQTGLTLLGETSVTPAVSAPPAPAAPARVPFDPTLEGPMAREQRLLGQALPESIGVVVRVLRLKRQLLAEFASAAKVSSAPFTFIEAKRNIVGSLTWQLKFIPRAEVGALIMDLESAEGRYKILVLLGVGARIATPLKKLLASEGLASGWLVATDAGRLAAMNKCLAELDAAYNEAFRALAAAQVARN
jgi:hypothetical protein